MRFAVNAILGSLFSAAICGSSVALAQTVSADDPMTCAPVHDLVNRADAAAGIGGKSYGRTICADVVALDQMLVYNRFGSFNPFGMIYALRRDLVPASDLPELVTADACDATLGTETSRQPLSAGKVRLKDCKRPRPLVLRANVGDILHVRMGNLLTQVAPNLSDDFCAAAAPRGHEFATIAKHVSRGDNLQVDHGEKLCRQPASSPTPGGDGNWPAERGLNFAVQGMTVFGLANGAITQAHDACLGLGAVPTGRAVDCYYRVDREGPFFLASTAAPSGGQGDGGSITHGLFGAILVQNAQTEWFRSQVTLGAFRAVWPEGTARHSVKDLRGIDAYRDTLNTDALDRLHTPAGLRPREAETVARHIRARNVEKTPILNMLQDLGRQTYQLVHADLNAIVHTPETATAKATSFREFGVFFHDEIKSFYTRNYDELAQYGQLAGARDGFAINYGASGMGTMLLANRKKIGPAASCAECLYEEFFLTSWANGDPALLEHFPDDPSNVHHSYLNDPVVYRNFHAGPKETHVFHLHAHQWFAGNDQGRGAYLDSQTVGPQQGFSYHIYGGGMQVYHPSGTPGLPGWYETLGSGNRNRTVGDSIFHCHLYPHFAQGMWELWRVHDVLEDGSRKLPDGQWQPGFSISENTDALKRRPGSVDHATGRLIDPAKSGLAGRQIGTPVPALVPLPTEAWPLLPTYPEDVAVLAKDGTVKADPVAQITTFPGYPYYIAGKPGHRPPQAPLDIAREVDRKATPEDATDDVLLAEYLDGGLPRHVMTANSTRETPFAIDGAEAILNDPNAAREKKEAALAQVVAKSLALGDMTLHLKTAELDLIPYDGSPLERAAMAFHADGAGLSLQDALGSSVVPNAGTGTYPSRGSGGVVLPFAVNGAAAKPGAPFADPCGVSKLAANGQVLHDPTVQTTAGVADYFTDPALAGFRRYEGSAVQLDMVTNRAGWHDPQARINVLTARSDEYKVGGGAWSPKVSADEQPFFFRALSGECIEFRHTNELPHKLELDDFQVRTPTDTIGQHIHLVKFDVTASDGSANGFNYEDGTFAPDEIAHRICAAKNKMLGSSKYIDEGTGTTRQPGALQIREIKGLCVKDPKGHWTVSDTYYDKIWKLALSKNRKLFQTTVQRWFADPILSAIRAPGQPGPAVSGDSTHDRTLRTVFSHDHFGPSSIQQHGFYTALVIEPRHAQICSPTNPNDCTPLRSDNRLILASDDDVGARKIIRDNRSLESYAKGEDVSQDFREFALAVADFALLYDPRDTTPVETVLHSFDAGQSDASPFAKGFGTLVCEGMNAENPGAMKTVCGSALIDDAGVWSAAPDDMPPAWVAAGRQCDVASHQVGLTLPLLTPAEVAPQAYDTQSVAYKDLSLADQLIRWRRMAAGYDGHDPKAPLARPVSAPARPESISVDHHDPYLVNYRGEPLPLRLGADSSQSPDCELKDPSYWVAALETGVTERCEVSEVRSGPRGDLANVFLSPDKTADGTSALHGDPAVLPLATNENDPVVIRLIQGAQEVQHSFTIEGYTWPRNLDQAFPADLPRMDSIMPRSTLVAACQHAPVLAGGLSVAQAGRPEEYRLWMQNGLAGFAPGSDALEYWTRFEQVLADCFNVEGRVSTQEIGISEHFEFSAAYLHDSNLEGVGGGTIRALAGARFKQARVGLQETPLSRLNNDLVDLQANLQSALQKARPSDSLVHFGSTDALWNGAWTLLRVHPKSTRRFDPRYLSDLRDAISLTERALTGDLFGPAAKDQAQRLPDLDDPVTQRQLAFAERALRQGRSVLMTPRYQPDGQVLPIGLREGQGPDLVPPPALRQSLPEPTGRYLQERLKADRLRQPRGDTLFQPQLRAVCDPSAPRVYTAIIAIEARSLFKGETRYSPVLTDPDGLFFAVVDPRRLLQPLSPEKVTPAAMDDPASWTKIPFDRVQAEIRRAYSRPEPMVLNVKAGDCVHAVWLNALRGADGQTRLRDLLGDAAMPGITSVNVDAAWSEDETENTPAVFAGSDRADVAPSSRLAISFPLPIMDRESSFARPYGVNPVWALAGLGSDLTLSSLDRADRNGNERVAQIMLTQFYAGRVMGAPRPKTPWMLLSALPASGPDSVLGLLRASASQSLVDLSGLTVQRLELAGLDPATATRLRARLDAQPTAEPVIEILQDLVVNRSRTLAVAQRRIAALLQSQPDLAGQLTLGEAVPEAALQPLPGHKARPPRDALKAAETVVNGRFFAQGEVWAHPVTLPPDLAAKLGFKVSKDPVDVALADLPEALTGLLPPSQIDELAKVIADLDQRLTDLDTQRDAVIATLPVAQDLLRALAALDLHFVPYAFGALPVKSTGDVIGHGAHGLFGAITVVPAGAEITQTRIQRAEMNAPGRSLCLTPQTLITRGVIGDAPFVLRPETLLPDLGRLAPIAACKDFVMVPGATDEDRANALPMWTAHLATTGPDGSTHRIRQFTLFWQDGLNLNDSKTRDRHVPEVTVGSRRSVPLVADCKICDDSYDLGEKGVSYRSEPFHIRLRPNTANPPESHYNLNHYPFPSPFFRLKPSELGGAFKAPVPVLRAEAGEQITVHVVHPGGRARQRAFVSIAQDYDDLFHGFGFPRSALLAPGKAITAQMLRPAQEGCYLWFDGPAQTRSGGTWGLIDVVPKGSIDSLSVSRCTAPARGIPR